MGVVPAITRRILGEMEVMAIYRRCQSPAQRITYWLIASLGGGLFALFAVLLIYRSTNSAALWPILTIAGISATLYLATAYWWARRQVRRFLVRTMQPDGRLLVCLHCRYDLRGTIGEACPECGSAVTKLPPWVQQL